MKESWFEIEKDAMTGCHRSVLKLVTFRRIVGRVFEGLLDTDSVEDLEEAIERFQEKTKTTL